MFHRRQKLKNLKQFASLVRDKNGLVHQFHHWRLQLDRKFPTSSALAFCALGEPQRGLLLLEPLVASSPQ